MDRKVLFSIYQAIGVAQRIFDGKGKISFEEFEKEYSVFINKEKKYEPPKRNKKNL